MSKLIRGVPLIMAVNECGGEAVMREKLFVLSFLGLVGCGAETAGTAATVATLKAKETQQAQETKEQVVQQVNDAQKQAEQRLKAAEDK